jgi:hypothetical protein
MYTDNLFILSGSFSEDLFRRQRMFSVATLQARRPPIEEQLASIEVRRYCNLFRSFGRWSRLTRLWTKVMALLRQVRRVGCWL